LYSFVIAQVHAVPDQCFYGESSGSSSTQTFRRKSQQKQCMEMDWYFQKVTPVIAEDGDCAATCATHARFASMGIKEEHSLQPESTKNPYGWICFLSKGETVDMLAAQIPNIKARGPGYGKFMYIDNCGGPIMMAIPTFPDCQQAGNLGFGRAASNMQWLYRQVCDQAQTSPTGSLCLCSLRVTFGALPVPPQESTSQEESQRCTPAAVEDILVAIMGSLGWQHLKMTTTRGNFPCFDERDCVCEAPGMQQVACSEIKYDEI
jgi:hypothetical protein